jgi:hypothetical protein
VAHLFLKLGEVGLLRGAEAANEVPAAEDEEAGLTALIEDAGAELADE